MKILHIHENFDIKGGSEVYIYNILNSLKSRGHCTELLAIQPSQKGYKIRSTYNDGELYILKKNLDVFFKNLFSEYKFEIIHIHGISDAFLIKVLSDLAPIVRSAHEPRMFCPGASKFYFRSGLVCNKPFGLHCLAHAYTEMCTNRHPKRIYKAFQNTLFEINEGSKIYKKIIVMSDYMHNEALQVGYPKDKLMCLPYFTDFESLVNIHNNNSNKTKRLLFTGRLIKHKGILFLLKSIASLLKSNDEIQFDIVGEGPQRDEIEKFIKEEDLGMKVKVYGWSSSDTLKEFYKQASIVMFPSIYPEAFGIVGLEAMAYGKPVIGFNRGGVSTWLKDGVNGFLIRKEDTKGLIFALDRLLNDEVLYTQMSRNAFQLLKAEFSEQNHITKLVNLYQEAISE